jgi:serine protease AprX
MIQRFYKTSKLSIALVLVALLSAVPALAGITVSGADGITVSGADGILYNHTSGITVSGADGILAFGPNGITVSGADGFLNTGTDGITVSGADGITVSGADSTTITRADGITVSGADGITVSGADGNIYKVDSVTIRNPTGITVSGADNLIGTGVNGITVSGADTRNIAHADGITVSGADNTLTLNGADSILAVNADGTVFSITPSAITISGVSGLTGTGVDGITVSGADSFVQTGVSAIVAAMDAAAARAGLQSVDPELSLLLNRLTDDSNVDAVIVYHHLPTDADIADLQSIGVLGGTRYHSLPMIAVTTSKRKLTAVSHLSSVRSIYGNRTFQWNLEPAAKTVTSVDRINRNPDLTRLNNGLPISGRGVTVAVLDTGIDGLHGDLSGRVVQNIKLADTLSAGVGFNYPMAAPSLPNTDQAYGHGTFVAGVIAGNGQQSNGKYAGVAPGANILGLSAGDASLLFILSGFDYLLSNGHSFGVRVVNCSFSANTVFDVNDPVNVATRILTDNGVNVVFSAGNTGPGPDSLNPYAVPPWVISTGATDNKGKLADFSSRGDFGSSLFRPTIVAPGVNTVSLRASTIAAVTTIDGLGPNGAALSPSDAALSPSELPYYTTGSGTSFSAPQVTGTVALMLEANPQLSPAQIRDILQRTATPLPPYYSYEVGAGMLNAQAAVLEAAFPQRHFGQWRGPANQNQVLFTNSAPQTFSGSATPGFASDSSLTFPANAVLASAQIAWGDLLSPNNLSLTLFDSQGVKQAAANALNAPGLTGHRERTVVNLPTSGNWKAHVENVASTATPNGSGTTVGMTSGSYGSQTFTGVLKYTTARYAPLADIAGLDSSSVAEIYQNFRGFSMAPIGSNFRPSFSVSRADLAAALVLGGRIPQYLPSQSSYPDIRDRATMLFVESAQAAPNGALFPGTNAGGAFQPNTTVDRLTAVVALVRAAGLRQQAETGTYTLNFVDASSIPASMRGYVAVAVQNGLIKTDGVNFRPQSAFTRLDLSHALARLAALATQ